MQGNNQGYQPPKMNNGAKGALWAGGIGGIIAIIVGVIFVLPGLVYVIFFLLASGVDGVVGEENMPYHANNRKGVTEAVSKFTPNPSWTEISKTEVHKPAACTDADRKTPQEDCEMFKGVWNTHTPHNENSILEVAKSFGGVNKYDNRPDVIKDACVRPSPEAPLDPCTMTTYVSSNNLQNSYGFTLTLSDQGPGTDVIATVTYVR
jgi:hypothetical protein